MRNHLPNLLTLGNLFFGTLALCVFTKVIAYPLWLGLMFLAIAALLDVLDGMIARWLQAQSPLGKELDSLADLVSFGVAPVFCVFALLKMEVWTKMVWGLIPVSSALRLGRFNLDTEQQHYFKGLPTPANALFLIALAYNLQHFWEVPPVWLMIMIAVIDGVLLNAPLPLLSLKKEVFRWVLIGWLLVMLWIVWWLPHWSAVIGLGSYIGVSVVIFKWKENK